MTVTQHGRYTSFLTNHHQNSRLSLTKLIP